MLSESLWNDLGEITRKIYSQIREKYDKPSPNVIRNYIESLLKKRVIKLEKNLTGNQIENKALFCHISRHDGFITLKRAFLKRENSLLSLTFTSVNGNKEKLEGGIIAKTYYLTGISPSTGDIPKTPLIWYEVWYASKDPQLLMNIVFPDVEMLKECFTKVVDSKSNKKKKAALMKFLHPQFHYIFG